MKKIIFAFMVIGSIFDTIYAKQQRQHILIQHKSIPTLDGSILLDEATIKDCLYSMHHTTELFKGKYDFETKIYTKKYQLNGQPVGLHDLVKIEQNYAKMNINMEDPQHRALNDCLFQMKEDFKTIQEPLLEKASKSTIQQKTTQELMNEWIEKAGRQDSLLKHWGSKNQFEPLYKATAAEFYQFCLDLKHFLEDLIFSCPKARERYKLIVLKSDPEKCAHFDKAFSNH